MLQVGADFLNLPFGRPIAIEAVSLLLTEEFSMRASRESILAHIPSRAGAPLALALFAISMLGNAACGYGSLTSWEPAEPDDQEQGEGEVELDQSGPVSKACIDDGTPSAGDAPARLLTNFEYEQTVRDLLGVTGNFSEDFPSENKVNGLENNADAHTASRLLIRKYMEASETAADAISEERLEELLPCDPAEVGERECGERFVQTFLRRAFRRPPEKGEVDDFVELFDRGVQQWNFREGVELVVRAALQSPQFLYRLKLVDDVSTGETVLLDNFEMATRLSYLLWASMPDEELLEAAENGQLETTTQIEEQARRMLDDPRAQYAVSQFHRQWLHLDDFDSVVKSAEAFEDPMTEDWRRSMRQFILDVYFAEDGTVEDLLTSRRVFLTGRLAELYEGVEPKDSSGLEAYAFDDERRAGLLTQPSLMALLANAEQSSPIRRGVWIREQLLCQTLEPPPADAEIVAPDPDPNLTTRERFHEHTANPTCAGCHAKIDPIGFGFSHYDSLGRWRSRENDKPVNAKGHLSETGEPEIEGKFDGAVELADRLADSARVENCIAQRWFTYALGGPPSESEECSLSRVQQTFAESGGDFQEMLVALATSEAFRYRTVATPGETQ